MDMAAIHGEVAQMKQGFDRMDGKNYQATSGVGGGDGGLGIALSTVDFSAGYYNEYLHNPTTYKTTQGIEKTIFKANGVVRSARASKFANISRGVGRFAVVGSVLSRGYSRTTTG
jgi:hypothetical protein